MAIDKCGVYELVIGPNQDIRQCLDAYIMQQGWKQVYISGAIGSITEVFLSAPLSAKLPPNVGITHYVGAAEVSSFVGYAYQRALAPADEIMLDPQIDSPLYVHIHMSCGISGGHTYAGGFRGGTTMRAMNVFMFPLA